MDPKSYPKLVFFDGVCTLCNGFVDFLVRHDPSCRVKIAPLQGSTAHEILGPKSAQELASILYLEDGVIHRESSAALKTLEALGGLWRLAALLRAIPPPIRDTVYRWIARNRYCWFGKKDSCRIPTPEEREHFLN